MALKTSISVVAGRVAERILRWQEAFGCAPSAVAVWAAHEGALFKRVAPLGAGGRVIAEGVAEWAE